MRRARNAVLGLASLLASFAAHASIVQRMEIEDLARAAQLVVVARVESVQATWEPEGDAIRTHAMLVVESGIAGVAPQRVHVSVLGGTVDGMGAGYPAGASFREGERVVVFLEARRGRTAEFMVTGAFQGLFLIEREAETGMDIAVRESSREGVALVGGGEDDALPLRLYTDELVARVHSARGAR